MKLAHRKLNENGTFDNQSIQDHCRNVASLAEGFAKTFDAETLAHYIGVLHDVGKYSEAFQRRINGSNERVDHSTAGAQTAWKSGTPAGMMAAFCIGGHHSGLPDLGSRYDDASQGSLYGKMCRTPEPFDEYRQEINVNTPQLPDWVVHSYNPYFFTKMLFSSLVDADYLDTEAFMSNGTISRNQGEPLVDLSVKLDRYIAPWKNPTSELNRKRSEIMQSVASKATNPKGMFSLTVPTGGGKTITSVAFALRHALQHGMQRIIYVIPYTSIIEQTQKIFENIFGESNVVAHYANVEYAHPESDTDDCRYLATENWDAPIILTTSVQFFESLYGNRPSKCRKLHNIANSVIIFDEAQMLPVPFMRPCVLAVAQMVQNYRCSAVLCTATQPALNPILHELAPELQIAELCPDSFFSDPVFTRVQYRQVGRLSDEELAVRVSTEQQVLCIVNSRKQAQTLYQMLPEDGRFHLSTWMTPEHRRRTLDTIRKRLLAGQICRVISTSLIEAGVDIDFPVVYRALAGLDSILQAGGRCNREGKRNTSESFVNIFETEYKNHGAIEQNCTAAQRTLSRQTDPASKEAIQSYFDFLLYTLKSKSALDQKNILDAMQELSFETIAKEFHLIEGAGYTVYIPCAESEELLMALKTFGPSKGLLRKLGQYSVSVYERQFRTMVESRAVEQLAENTAILTDRSKYSEETGLRMDANQQIKDWII